MDPSPDALPLQPFTSAWCDPVQRVHLDGRPPTVSGGLTDTANVKINSVEVRSYSAHVPVSDQMLHDMDLDNRCDSTCPQWRPPPTRRKRIRRKLDDILWVALHLHEYRIV